MQTTTSIKAGNAPDLLSGILSVQVRNEEKITEQDRLYCQSQQDVYKRQQLYQSQAISV